MTTNDHLKKIMQHVAKKSEYLEEANAFDNVIQNIFNNVMRKLTGSKKKTAAPQTPSERSLSPKTRERIPKKQDAPVTSYSDAIKQAGKENERMTDKKATADQTAISPSVKGPVTAPKKKLIPSYDDNIAKAGKASADYEAETAAVKKAAKKKVDDAPSNVPKGKLIPSYDDNIAKARKASADYESERDRTRTPAPEAKPGKPVANRVTPNNYPDPKVSSSNDVKANASRAALPSNIMPSKKAKTVSNTTKQVKKVVKRKVKSTPKYKANYKGGQGQRAVSLSQINKGVRIRKQGTDR